MVYNIAEIKYTSCYPVICNLVPKRQTLCTQARAIKSKFLKISKMAFLFICLLLLYRTYAYNNSTIQQLLNPKLNNYALYCSFRPNPNNYAWPFFCTQNQTTMLSSVPFVQHQTNIPGLRVVSI